MGEKPNKRYMRLVERTKNIIKNPRFDFIFLRDCCGWGESVLMMMTVAITNQSTPLATTDQMLLTEKIVSKMALPTSI